MTISLVLIIIRDGPSFSALIWPMQIALSAVFIGVLLAYRPNWLQPFAALVSPQEPSKP